MDCPVCQRRNPEGAAFCGGCGTALPRPVATPVAAAGRTSDRTLADTAVATGTAPPPTVASRPGTSSVPRQRPLRQRSEPRLADARAPVSEVTRHLCTAMHLDSSLAEKVVQDVVEPQRRAVAASPGVRVSVVARHALAAQRRHLLRDVLLAVLAVLILLAFASGSLGFTVLWLVLAWGVVLAESLIARYTVVARTLSRETFDETGGPEPADQQHQRRVAQLAAHEGGNVIVHSGFSPFVGHGVPIGGWSFALDVTKPAHAGDRPQDFAVPELREHVVSSLEALRWSALRLDDKVILAGNDLRGDDRFLPDPLAPPVSQVDTRLLGSLLVSPENRARPYLQVEVSGWDGELVASMFLRLVLLPCSLFVEASWSVLTPVQDKYHEADRLLPQPTAGQVLRLGRQAAWAFLPLTARAPGTVVAAAVSPVHRVRRDRAERRAIRADLTFDYGASVSVRELASDRDFQRYFQHLDKDMYLKIVEKRVLDSVVAFLDERGIDTAELVERSTTILNNGVMVSGNGRVQAETMAVGAGATAGGGRRAQRVGAALHRNGRRTRAR